MVGVGHRAPGFLGPCYLEGTYSYFFSECSEDAEGMKRFFKQFSFPGGIGSHCTPETPMNGALTIGPLDGANIEIQDAVGADNFFLFGLTAEEGVAKKAAGYNP